MLDNKKTQRGKIYTSSLKRELWNNLYKLILGIKYTPSELKYILDEWAKLLNVPLTHNWEYEGLHDDLKRIINELKVQVEDGQSILLYKCFQKMLYKDKFTENQLDIFLEDNDITFNQTNFMVEGSLKMEKRKKIFISHSAEDKDIVIAFVEFLEDIGIREEQIFCSSMSEYGIPLEAGDIYEYIKKQFNTYEFYIIFMLSDNYYKSVACLNEMGAVWVLQNKYMSILLPGFKLKVTQGAINPREIGVKLDNDIAKVKGELGQLKDILSKEFNLEEIRGPRWERKRDEFLRKISQK